MLDIEALVAAAEAFVAAPAERASLLGEVRDRLEQVRAADEESRGALAAYFERAPKAAAGAAESERVRRSRKDESTVAEALRPRVLSLQRYLTDTSPLDDPEAHELLQETVNVAIGYVAGYQNVRDHLITQEVQRRAATREILRARPVEGEVDYAELSREHIARYPKIRARLAQ